MEKQEQQTEALKPYAAPADETCLTADYPACLKDETTGICYLLPYGEWVIGRKDDLENDVPVTTEDEYMSRRHAIVKVELNELGETEIHIRDLKSTRNATYVEDRQIDKFEFRQLYPDEEVWMGITCFTIHILL